MKLLDTGDLTLFLMRVITQISQEQALSDRLVLAVGHAWRGVLTDDEFKKIVQQQQENRQSLEILAAEMSVAVAEKAVEQQ